MSLPVAVAWTQLGWWLSWWGAQRLVQAGGAALLVGSVTVFTVLYAAVFGVFAPLAVARRHHLQLELRPRPPHFRAGLLIMGVAVGVGCAGSGALGEIVTHPPPFAVWCKYLLLFAPMAAGVTLQSFFLVPCAVNGLIHEQRRWNGVVAAVLGGASAGLGFWIDQLFATGGLALIQFVLGFAMALGSVLTGSVAITFCAYLAIMMVNTLAEAKYFSYPWFPLVAGFVLACAFLYRHISLTRAGLASATVRGQTLPHHHRPRAK